MNFKIIVLLKAFKSAVHDAVLKNSSEPTFNILAVKILIRKIDLGKTIQSIAYLGSLFKENLYPHLVVAPLSTLRYCKREFATRAPHMNVNNPYELFMLMHFLDAGKYSSLEEFQLELKDINQEEQIARLRKSSSDDCWSLRLYKSCGNSIWTRNYELLTRKGGGHISLMNVVMELRTVFCHAYILDGVEPDIEDTNEAYCDWNPHADVQATVRAHWLSLTKVMIYRLITRGTIEERMMQLAKKELFWSIWFWETQSTNINQKELDDILRYVARKSFLRMRVMKLGQAHQIHYDGAAIGALARGKTKI
ncbi:hypothetical protein MKW98_019342 [Papaver atlanticum]|uniref:Uncharacterized protein n=1 Tax=Papaver atlanticum TaxID=357466 RepID=A0AAD4S926_9MAGN|nr:hypothetical protein MKW98_019342 [Papaver atlanticum]